MLLIFTSMDWNHLAKHVPCTPKIIMCFDLTWLNRIHWRLMTHICVNDLDLNSLAPGRCGSTLVGVIYEHMSRIKSPWTLFVFTIALMWMPQNTFDSKSTLVQVMAWCHQLMSHYLNQCWPGSVSPFGGCWAGVRCPQWVDRYWKWLGVCFAGGFVYVILLTGPWAPYQYKDGPFRYGDFHY